MLNVFILSALSTKKTCAKALAVVGIWTNANGMYLQNLIQISSAVGGLQMQVQARRILQL